MNFLNENDDLLEKYNTIWDRVNVDIKKEFDSKPVYNKNFSKTKIKSHSNEVTDFYDKEIPKVDSNHTCLAVISLDSALNKDGNYYPQAFLKEYKYTEKKVIRHINDNLSDFSSDDNSDDYMKKSVSFNESVKTFLLCKDNKEVFLTTLSTSYADYQRFLLCKLLLFLGSRSQH